MKKDYWSWALLISVTVHVMVITGLPPLANRLSLDSKDQLKEIEIVPDEIKREINQDLGDVKQVPPPPFIENILGKLMVDEDDFYRLSKPQITETNTKEIIFADIPQDKKLQDIPGYMEYYRLVREKIRSKAYHYYKSNSVGKVFVSFLVNKDGSLRDLFLGKDSVNIYSLKEISLRSVREAAPFPPFPQGLKDRSWLQFNIPIYFKNN